MNQLSWLCFVISISFMLHSGIANTLKNDFSRERTTGFPYTVVEALHDFSFDMFGNISETLVRDDNMVFSPLSLFSVFSMLLEGLRGRSQTQVENLLHFSKLRSRHPAHLESRMCQDIFTPANNYTLVQENRLFIDREFDLVPHYRRIMTKRFKAPVKLLNIKQKPHQVRNRINRYVARKTKNLITDLLPPDSITSDTTMLIVNTLYLQAPWEFPFPKFDSGTTGHLFHVSNDEEISIPFMFNTHSRCIAKISEELQSKVLVMPFVDGTLHMIIMMPHQTGNFSVFEQPRSSEVVSSVLEKIFSTPTPIMKSCHINMPKFSVSHRLSDLQETLTSMGVVDIFDDALGNFSRLTTSDGLYVQSVDHKTVIEVDENGVKAAAASAITAGVRMAFPYVNINKPFVFMIRHSKTKAILFLGRIIRPQSSK